MKCVSILDRTIKHLYITPTNVQGAATAAPFAYKKI
jgi:hypothetical protein